MLYSLINPTNYHQMKKTSTLAMSLLLAAGAWCGLAYAGASDPVYTAGETTATFDFKTNQYGYPTESGNSSKYLTDEGVNAELLESQDRVHITFSKGTGAGVRFWAASNGTELRVMKNSNITISVPGGDICGISFTATKNANKLTPSNSSFMALGGTGTLCTFANVGGTIETVTFTASDRVDITKIEVQFTGGVIDTRLNADLAIEGNQSVFTAILDEEFQAPVITKATDAPLTFTSSNTAVAEIATDGSSITLVGTGSTVITASAPQTDNYKAGSIFYTLNVLPAGTVFNSAMGTDFTFEPDADIWVHDAQYGLKGTGYISAVGNIVAEAIAVSPEITLPASNEATLYFDQAINYLKGASIADFANIVVREVESENNGGYYYDDNAEWLTIADAVTAPEGDSWNFYANEPVDLTAFAGKTIQIGFKYNSTNETAMTWEVKNIIVTSVDPLKSIKEAAVEEVLGYLALAPGEYNPWMAMNYEKTINGCTTAEEVAEAIEYCIGQIRDRVYAALDFNFTWGAPDGKFVSYIAEPAAGLSPWQAADFTTASVFVGERVNERVWTPWSLAEGDDEPETNVRETNDHDAVTVRNIKTGLYLAFPANAGEVVTSTADVTKAGYVSVKCTQGKIALADDATGLFITLDPEKGLILSETPENITLAELNVWDKEDGYSIYVEFSNQAEGEWGMLFTDEISYVKVAVTEGLKVSDIGEISIVGHDLNWQEFNVAVFNANALAAMTPEKGIGYNMVWNNETFMNEKVPFDADVYTLQLRNPVTEAGNYTVNINEGTFYTEIDGKTFFSTEEHATIQIEATPVACQPVVTPAEGQINDLETITITGGEEIILNICWESGNSEITLTSDEQTLKSWTKDDVLASLLVKEDMWNDPDVYELNLGEKITANGTYVLTIPAGFFVNESQNLNEETVITWTINNEEEDDSITEINANGAASNAYDLQGRRVSKPANGLFIINGKKVLIRK